MYHLPSQKEISAQVSHKELIELYTEIIYNNTLKVSTENRGK